MSVLASALDTFWRPNRDTARDVRLDVIWLLGLGLLLVATGLGLRDPWPADEPRFALVARDMVLTGQWLFPQIGGDWYADKPPVFFWLIALFFKLTGSLRIAFLLPSLLATLAATLLVYDLVRRLWNREAAFAAGWLLLVTFQFVWQGRQAQIDAVLYFWTTLSLYSLLRHLLLGPDWRWYAVGWAAAGFGVITKGVGFLPLLVLAIYAVLRRLGWSNGAVTQSSVRHWGWGPLAFLAAVSVWLAPMLLSANTPELAAYRDEILFHQTVNRYAAAWHHHEPFWYYLVQVIPPLWLPLSALLPWLWPHWRAALRSKDMRTALPLLWVLAVIVFFSASAGKRGVYVLPAIPALVIAAAPWLPELFERTGPRRVFIALASVLCAAPILGAIYMVVAPHARADLLAEYGVDGLGPLAAIGCVALVGCLVLRVRQAVLTYTVCLATALVVVGFWINPAINEVRSGRQFVREIEAAAADAPELGLVGYKEQYLLNLSRVTVNFGHARWREADVEAADAAAWLAAQPGRALLVTSGARELCFPDAQSVSLGRVNSSDWFLVRGVAKPECVARGNLKAARAYTPP